MPTSPFFTVMSLPGIEGMCLTACRERHFVFSVLTVKPLVKQLLHPYHVIPFAELVAAAVEMSHTPIPHLLMEYCALMGQMPVRRLCPCYARIDVDESPLSKLFFQPPEQTPAYALPMGLLRDIDARLDTMAVGLTLLEHPGIGISQNPAVMLSHKVRIPLERACDALTELLDGRHGILEGYGRMLYVRGVYLQQ